MLIITGNSSAKTILLSYGNAKKHEGHYAVMAVKDSEGNFTLEEGREDELNKRKKEINKDISSDKAINRIMLSLLLFDIVAIVLAIVFHLPFRLLLALIIFLVGAYLPSCTLLNLPFSFYSTREANHCFYRCHAAEHKVINAFNKKKDQLPTLEEARAASRIHRECGCVNAGNWFTAVLSIALGIVFFPRFGFFRTFGVVLLILLLFFFLTIWSVNPWKLLEYLVTREPTDYELSMALAALERLLIRIDEGACTRAFGDKDWHLVSSDEEKSDSQE